jgi:DNA repair protein RadC
MTADKGLPEYYAMIRDLPAAERPLDRLRNDEPSHLSNAERLAIVLHTGTTSESVLSLRSGRFLSQFSHLVALS